MSAKADFLRNLMSSMQFCVLRYYSILLTRRNVQLQERHALFVSLSVLLSCVLLYLASFLLHAMFGLSFSHFEEVCLRGRMMPSIPLYTVATQTVSLFAPAAVSLLFAFLIVVKIRQTVNSEEDGNTTRKKNYTIPVNATIMSVLTIALYVVLAIIIFKVMPSPTGIIVSTITTSGLLALRCPLITRLTFAAKYEVDKKSREQRQEREREEARKARDQREWERALDTVNCTTYL